MLCGASFNSKVFKNVLNVEKKHPHTMLCQGEQLEWFDNQHQADTIHRMNVFRKSRKFCDLVLLVSYVFNLIVVPCAITIHRMFEDVAFTAKSLKKFFLTFFLVKYFVFDEVL